MDYQYTVYFEPLLEGGYQVVFPAIPEIITFGRTLEEAREMAPGRPTLPSRRSDAGRRTPALLKQDWANLRT